MCCNCHIYYVVVVVLPDPFRRVGAWRNSTETQQSGHAPRSGPEVKNGRSGAEEVEILCCRINYQTITTPNYTRIIAHVSKRLGSCAYHIGLRDYTWRWLDQFSRKCWILSERVFKSSKNLKQNWTATNVSIKSSEKYSGVVDNPYASNILDLFTGKNRNKADINTALNCTIVINWWYK